MGFIFDLKKNEDDEDARDFFIIGINLYANLTSSKSGPGYYVSKFTNVTELQAVNFGTKLKENKSNEDPIVEGENSAAFAALSGDVPTDDDDNPYVYVYAHCDSEGNYTWAILNASATDKVKSLSDKEFAALEFDSSMYLANGTIEASKTGYSKETQNDLAVYSVIYKGCSLSGKWNFVGTYKEAEEELL